MLASGESQNEVIRPDFNRAILIDFRVADVTSDTGTPAEKPRRHGCRIISVD